MESQDEEYKHNIWEIYHKEWATASPEKRIELDKRMHRWQELMKDGWSAQQAYYKAMEGELDFKAAEEPSGKQLAIPSPPRMRKAPLILLSLALVAAIVYSVVITGDRNALNTELQSVQSVLASTQSELGSTKETLSSTQSELGSTKETLSSTQSELGSTKETLSSTQSELTSTQLDLDSTEVELSSTKQNLSSTQTELSSTKQTLSSTQSELDSTKETLASAQSELGATKGKLETAEASLRLYQDTLGVEVLSGVQPLYKKPLSDDVTLINNPTATNPTWQELMVFLRIDPTDDEYYSPLYNCTNFAEMLHNNAEAKGIKVAFVAVQYSNRDVGHALNAFKTTDKGLVYVDCTGGDFSERFRQQLYSYTVEYDSVAYAFKGKEYRRWGIDKYTFGGYRYYEPYRQTSDWEGSDIVESIRIYW